MNGIGEYWSKVGRPEHFDQAELTDIMGSIQEEMRRGMGGAGQEMAGRAGMVDPFAAAQRALPFQEQALGRMRAVTQEDRRRGYQKMIEEMQKRAAKREQSALTGQMIGGVAGSFLGPAGAAFGGAAGTAIGGMI